MIFFMKKNKLCSGSFLKFLKFFDSKFSKQETAQPGEHKKIRKQTLMKNTEDELKTFSKTKVS